MTWATSQRFSASPPVPKAWRMVRVDWGEIRPSGTVLTNVGDELGDSMEMWYSGSSSTLMETCGGGIRRGSSKLGDNGDSLEALWE